MYTEFFGLNEKPFSITPDPRYLYLSRRHADALAHLIYGISESGGFIQLTGEVGTGKTTLIRSVLEQLPDKAEIALILNPPLSSGEFLENICEELRVSTEPGSTPRELIGALNAHLLKAHAEGRRVVLIVDEAQTLGSELLEQVRLLTNLETPKQKLLQIILIGQPELRDILKRPEMRQLAQRVTGRYHLEPLSGVETAQYVRHRLRVAGCQAAIFSEGALRALYRRSKGIPRLVNVIADRALLAAYTRDRTRVDAALVRRAAAEVFGQRAFPFSLPRASFSLPWAAAAAAAAGVGLAAVIVGALMLFGPAAPSHAPGAQAPAPSAVERTAVGTPAGPISRGVISETRIGAGTARAVLPGNGSALEEPEAGEESDSSGIPELLADPAARTDIDSAFSELFALWEASYDASRGEPCSQAAEQGLRCLFRPQGSIGALRHLNRPAILTLVDPEGGTHEVVITKLGYDEAALIAGEAKVRVRLSELTHYWYGDHLFLWQPPAMSATVSPGMQNETVAWVRESLARLRGDEPQGPHSPYYDARLEAEVRSYQRERMLTVDGIVGEMTQLALTSDLGEPASPTLRGDY